MTSPLTTLGTDDPRRQDPDVAAPPSPGKDRGRRRPSHPGGDEPAPRKVKGGSPSADVEESIGARRGRLKGSRKLFFGDFLGLPPPAAGGCPERRWRAATSICRMTD